MRVSNKSHIVVALCLMLAIGFGCAKSNAVKLTYALGPTNAPCAGEAVVFKFKDSRSTTRLGTDNDGAPIESLSNVADWAGWALFDELRAAGCDVKYRTTTVSPGKTALITGEVLEVTLNQTGATTHAGKVTMKISVVRDGQTLLIEKYTSEVEDAVVPGYGDRPDIMAEALRGALASAVPAICEKL